MKAKMALAIFAEYEVKNVNKIEAAAATEFVIDFESIGLELFLSLPQQLYYFFIPPPTLRERGFIALSLHAGLSLQPSRARCSIRSTQCLETES